MSIGLCPLRMFFFQACLLCGLIFSPCVADDFASDARGTCVESSNGNDRATASLLQVSGRRSSPRASAPQHSEVDPDLEWTGRHWKKHGEWTWMERWDLMCYLKRKLQSSFRSKLSPLGGAVPFGTALHDKKCAVVSSSGALLDHEYGSAIDSADVVFRLNDAPLTGFEKYVGSRETVRVAFRASDFLGDLPAVDKQDLKPDVSYLVPTPGRKLERRLLQEFPKSRFYGFPYSLYQEVGKVLGEIYSDRWLNMSQAEHEIVTTGCVGMFFAISFCRKVESFEMVPSAIAYHENTSYNYYGKHPAGAKASDNAIHAFFGAEHDLWRRLSENRSTDSFKTGRAVINGFDALDCNHTFRGLVPHASYIPHIH